MNIVPFPNGMANSGYSLLTGATGLVGNYLLRDLLCQGHPVAAVVRPDRKLTAEQRIEVILQRWEKELGVTLPRPVVFAGDIALPGFGLGADDHRWIQTHCHQMIHNAAILKFHGKGMEEEPWRTNLGGTKHALELARLSGIRDFHYVSTAYVSGIRSETVYEDELECGQTFRNDYERSKFRAELLVHAAEGFDSKTLYRPAVIVGDSRTGFTTTYHGLYLYLRLLATLVPEQERDEQGKFITPIELPMRGDEPRNLVPVDWVSSVITHLIGTPAARNRTYHLIPDRCTTAREVIDACYRYFNSDGVVYKGNAAERRTDNEFAARFFENARVYESYETSDPRYDNRNLKRFAGHLPCPHVDEEMILRFLEFGVADNWGKRRTPAPEVQRWFLHEVDELMLGARRFDFGPLRRPGHQQVRIGLDVRGPGGGQWQLVSGPGGVTFHRGLPLESDHTIRVCTSHLKNEQDRQAFWESRLRALRPLS